MLRAIESHVLQEVCQATLALIFVDRTYALGNVEVCHMLRILVVTNVISQSVVQLTHANGGIYWDWRHLHFLCHHDCAAHEGEGSHKNSFQFHHIIVLIFVSS